LNPEKEHSKAQQSQDHKDIDQDSFLHEDSPLLSVFELRLVAITNKMLIKPAPTLSSKAPAKGAPSRKNRIDKTILPIPIATIITISFLESNTQSEVARKPIVSIEIYIVASDIATSGNLLGAVIKVVSVWRIRV
jgi:hypothetical protein